MMLKYLTLFLLAFPAFVYAQNSIVGKVINDQGKPVADASVFLNNTSVGSTTRADGTFTLRTSYNGQYELTISCVGYDTYKLPVSLNNTNINLPDVKVVSKTTQLKEVAIKYDANRDANLKQFILEFLGSSSNSNACKITNLDILDITYNNPTRTLEASSDDFLLIENNSLGYHVKFLLNSFVKNSNNRQVGYNGSTIFEPMTGTKSQQKTWEKNRRKAYLGSSMHFLRSCIGMRFEDEGFTAFRLIRKPNPERPPDSLIKAKIKQFRSANHIINLSDDSLRYWLQKSGLPLMVDYVVKKPLTIKEFIRLTDLKGVYAIMFNDCLYITYHKDFDNATTISFKDPTVYFDNNGVIINPLSCLMQGYWGIQRVADLLPVDYVLPELR